MQAELQRREAENAHFNTLGFIASMAFQILDITTESDVHLANTRLRLAQEALTSALWWVSRWEALS